MAYGMKRGAAPKYKELGSSPLEYEKDPKEFAKRKSGPKVDPDAPGEPGTPGYEPKVKSTDYLTKIPTGPRATKKPSNEVTGDVKLDPGYEDPAKIQKVQRKGLTPHSQKFSKKAKKSVK